MLAQQATNIIMLNGGNFVYLRNSIVVNLGHSVGLKKYEIIRKVFKFGDNIWGKKIMNPILHPFTPPGTSLN